MKVHKRLNSTSRPGCGQFDIDDNRVGAAREILPHIKELSPQDLSSCTAHESPCRSLRRLDITNLPSRSP